MPGLVNQYYYQCRYILFGNT